ncbi:transporter substrate-binding domain-containing protein [Enterovirga sp.]|uniref:transporter substrate-binding domain-containing protein n=1 Tax=Enterovirga sp. TaxID=2026350 RepID=UPI002C453E4B|nr:transporter substrate-binding domain-containing protein [Enterovirga sp.]HMO29497.1 transporter substrate-binding domain-containing protein [Enterovirga sp.]
MARTNLLTAISAVCGAALGMAVMPSQAQCLPAPPNLVEAGYLTVGTSLTAPPMGFMKDDTPSGFDPEFITAVAEKMCLKTRIVNVTFQGLFPGLIAKKFDVVASQIGITEPRKEMFDFVPVFVGGLRLVTQKNSGLRFQTESDVCGHSASIVAGSTQMAALERVKGDCPAGKPMTLKVFSNQSEALNEVAKGTVNVAYVDWPVAAYLIQQRPNDFVEASPVLSGKGPNTERNRNGIVIRKGESAAQDAVAAAVKAAMGSGAYDAILKRWNLADGDVRKAN